MAFLLALLANRSDVLVAVMIGLPAKILEEAAEKGTAAVAATSVSLTESERKRHRQDGLNQLLRSSSTRPQQSISHAAMAKPFSQQVDASTPQPQELAEELRGSRFDWSPYMLPTSAISPQKSILHGMCRRWIDLTRQMDRTAATRTSPYPSCDSLQPPSQAEIGQLQAILVVRIAELLNGIAGRLLYPQWAALMHDKKLDVNSFIVRWHINLHPSIRTRLPASSLQNLSLF